MARRIAVLLAILCTLPALAQKTLSPPQAKNHIGEQATVCGKIVSTRYADTTRGSPTLLNFDEPYPNQIFTLLIWGSDRPKFGNPETAYRGKQLCVSGRINSYKGVPEIVASDPTQVKVQVQKASDQ